MDVLLGIWRDIWTTMFGLPDSTMELIFGTLSSIFGWFSAIGASISKIIEVFQEFS